jgi:heat shock protein 90kDa beta
LTKPDTYDSPKGLEMDIRVEVDVENKMLHITDHGIGMTRTDLIDNIGTIASSGTKKFLEALQEGVDMNLIGQFGVGFYSAFLVADTVVVRTKHVDDVQLIWTSKAEDTFSIEEDPEGNTLGRGTRVTLHMREDAEEFISGEKARELVKHYSEFIDFPIYLRVSKEVEKEVPVVDGDVDEEEQEDWSDGEEEDLNVDEEEEEEKENKEKVRIVKETVYEWELLNDQKPIWTRSRDDVSDEEYQGFFKSLTKSEDDAVAWTHFSAEGDINFKSILYLPEKSSSDLSQELQMKKNQMRLYVRKIFISDEIDGILPRYLNFLRGIVDSDDLSLNVSREFLQQSRLIKLLKKKLVRKALDLMRDLAREEEKEEEKEEEEESTEELNTGTPSRYSKFWTKFGTFLKIGMLEDKPNQKRISNLLRFRSTKTDEDEWISLSDYVKSMVPGQKSAYFITGSNFAEMVNSPLLDELKRRDIEVLIMTDPVDDYVMQSFTDFEGHHFQDVTKDGMKIEGNDSERIESIEKEMKERYEPLTTWLVETLGKDRITSASVGMRLRESPCVLVASRWGPTANMERILKAQTVDEDILKSMKARRVMEINPHHPIVKALLERVSNTNENGPDDSAKDLAMLMYETAAIQSGFDLEDTNEFARRIHRVLKMGLSIDPVETVDDIQIEQDREEAYNQAMEKEAAKAVEEDLEEEDEINFEDDEMFHASMKDEL